MASGTITLTDEQREFFERTNFGHLATIGSTGAPQVTPVWVDVEDGRILVNTARGRVKQRNVDRDPRVAISITDTENPYRMVTIQGRVTRQIDEGADEHIDKLAKKYLSRDSYPWRSTEEQRVILEIEPERIAGVGA